MIRISDEELELDVDLSLYKGKPFTGSAFEMSNTGIMLSEIPYVDGFSCGVVRLWYRSGKPREEYSCRRGLRDGKSYSWFESGAVRTEAIHELGVELLYKEWNEQGNLIVDRKIETGSVSEKILQKHRSIYGAC